MPKLKNVKPKVAPFCYY